MTAAVRAHLPSFQVVWCQEQNVCGSEKKPTSGNDLWFSAELVNSGWFPYNAAGNLVAM